MILPALDPQGGARCSAEVQGWLLQAAEQRAPTWDEMTAPGPGPPAHQEHDTTTSSPASRQLRPIRQGPTAEVARTNAPGAQAPGSGARA